jgi:hypothetical protein
MVAQCFSASSRLGLKTCSLNGNVTKVNLRHVSQLCFLLKLVNTSALSGVTPSLKNLLTSVFAGGLVFAVIASAVIAVSNFDPVERS